MSTLPPLAAPSLRPFGHPILDQGAAGSCFAFAVAEALWAYYRANGREDIPLASPGAIYYPARREEWAGQDPESVPPLQDTGTYPDLGIRAVQGVGFVPWDAYPYPTDYATLYSESAMLRYVNAQPPANVLVQAYDQRGLEWGLITETGEARCVAVEGALRHRCSVIFGMQLDEGFMDNAGELVSDIDGRFIVGGHMLMVDDSDGAIFGGPNHWGTSWGARGYWRMTRALFGSSWISDVIVIKGAPLPEAA